MPLLAIATTDKAFFNLKLERKTMRTVEAAAHMLNCTVEDVFDAVVAHYETIDKDFQAHTKNCATCPHPYSDRAPRKHPGRRGSKAKASEASA